MTSLTNEQQKLRYTRKKQSCKQRMIDFDITFDQWMIYEHLKGVFTCAYTNQAFVSRVDHPNQPTLERINDSKGYSVQNCVLVSKLSNDLKNTHVFLSKNTDGLSEKELSFVHRINKILNSKENIENIMKPYYTYFGYTGENDKPVEIQENTNIVNPMKKMMKKPLSRPIIEKKNMKDNKLVIARKVEMEFVEHYYTIAMFFDNIGIPFDVSIGQFRSKMRCKADQINGVEFKTINDKRVYVIDKTAPVTVNNIKIVHASTQIALDTIMKDTTKDVLIANLNKL